ncbi:MAG: hypothetical protein ACT4R6_11950 [Gemmatimonadaceae bacterium]
MSNEMGSFRTDVEIENIARPGPRVRFGGVLVDTGAELSWFPATDLEALGIKRLKLMRFRQASGDVLERWTGGVLVHAAGTATFDEVVFGEPRDLVLLGSRTLEGLNVTIDPVSKRLVDAGPAPAAVAA